MSNPKKPRKAPEKTCFLVTPIGSDHSPERRRVDQWMKLIYEPALGSQYKIVRADKISLPGIITEQILQNIIDADLVIIDYTGLNPNVMYEAAVRHLSGKPYIQIYDNSVHLPFDIQNLRTIFYDPTKLDYPNDLIQEMKQNVKVINSPKYKHPQFIKEKFDFEKIISDPERFVELLKKHITIPNGSKKSEEAIVTVANSYNDPTSIHLRSSSKKITCPKCRTIKYEEIYGSLLGAATVTGAYSGSIFGNHHYRCNNCGTEFEQ